jgi:hypothetical protein
MTDEPEVDLPTPEACDALLAHLPILEQPGRVFVERWAGGERTPDGHLTGTYPIYLPDVEAFFAEASKPIWMEPAYLENPVQAWLDEKALIASANLQRVRVLLTYCTRGERFTDGFWNEILTRGQVQAVLRRLAQLRALM